MKTTEGEKTPVYKVFLENLQDKIPVGEELTALIQKTVDESLKLEDMKIGCEVGISLVDDVGIKQLNKEFRNIDTPTDVLSFPMAEIIEGDIISTEGDFDHEEGLLLLGDIVISLERAKRQAEDYLHTFEREVAFLTTHGVFHLLGYDHEDSAEEMRMLEKQEEVLSKLGLVRK